MSLRTETASSNGTSITAVQNWVGLQENAAGSVTVLDSRLALTIYPYHIPGQVLSYLLNTPSVSLATINDQSADPNIIHIESEQQLADPSLVPVTRQDWYFDARTGLPIRVDYYLPDPTNSKNDGTASVVFLGWQKTSSTLVPQSIQQLSNGAVACLLTIGPPGYNQGLSAATTFKLP